MLSEGGTLVPSFIYSVKETIPKRIYSGLFHITDWFPTILSFAQLPAKENIDGIDQSQSLTNSTVSNPRKSIIYGILVLGILISKPFLRVFRLFF